MTQPPTFTAQGTVAAPLCQTPSNSTLHPLGVWVLQITPDYSCGNHRPYVPLIITNFSAMVEGRICSVLINSQTSINA